MGHARCNFFKGKWMSFGEYKNITQANYENINYKKDCQDKVTYWIYT